MVRTQYLTLPYVRTNIAGYVGQPCDRDGYDIPEGEAPPPEEQRAENDYFPYSSRPEFELADFLFRTEQMSGKKISYLMEIWASYLRNAEDDPGIGPPFASAQDMYDRIDSTEVGDISWQVRVRQLIKFLERF